jgi:integrase
MQWTFQPAESKTKKLRIIRITDPAILEIVCQQMKQYRKGPLFRNTRGRPWTRKNLTDQFRRLKQRLAKEGIELDEDACMYSCRHTYAKRILQGYWTGKPTNIETLARLMGNSPQICREHYLQWSEIDNDPLWDAA